MRQPVLLSVLLVLASCSQSPRLQAIDVPVISAVQANIAHQVGLYILASQQEATIDVAGVQTPLSKIPPAPDGGNRFACGNGTVSFDVTSIKADLTTTSTDTYDISGSATIPADLVTIKPSLEGSKAVNNTQELKYAVWPLDFKDQPPAPPGTATIDPADAPIAYTLISLRSALLGAATRYDYSQSPPVLRPWKPCFRDFDLSKLSGGPGGGAGAGAGAGGEASSSDAAGKASEAAGNTYSIGLKVTKIGKAGLTVSVAGIVSLGANGTWQSDTGNTLTVSFGQTGLDKLADAMRQQKQACKNPKSSACSDATKTVENEAGHNGIGVLNLHKKFPGI